jgi:hypothetical protein
MAKADIDFEKELWDAANELINSASVLILYFSMGTIALARAH